jgi:hypothetical protein
MKLSDVRPGMLVSCPTHPILGVVEVTKVTSAGFEFDLGDDTDLDCARTGHHCLAVRGDVHFEPVSVRDNLRAFWAEVFEPASVQ